MPQMPEDLMKAADAAIADLAQDEAEMDAEFLKGQQALRQMQKEAKQAHEDPDRAYAEEVDEHGAEGKPRSRGRGKGRGKGRGRGRGRKAKGDPPKGSGKADPESMEAGEREKDEEDVEENEALPAGKRAKTKQLPRKRATSKEGDADPHAKKAKPDSSAAAARQDEHEDWCISIDKKETANDKREKDKEDLKAKQETVRPWVWWITFRNCAMVQLR
ncbi:unnamed protein product [Durusdinium trenchii]|uniref:Uncharacterized protein n=1 Tax=Durusdinium trenchii TaxID=1381693 RepID=A0ABP0PGX7_9DINO